MRISIKTENLLQRYKDNRFLAPGGQEIRNQEVHTTCSPGGDSIKCLHARELHWVFTCCNKATLPQKEPVVENQGGKEKAEKSGSRNSMADEK